MSFGNVRLVMAAPEGKPARLHSLAGKAIRYELPQVEEWKTAWRRWQPNSIP